MANSVDPDQTAPIGAVCSGYTLLASILNSSVILGNYLQQTTSAEDIFRCIFFLGALRVKVISWSIYYAFTGCNLRVGKFDVSASNMIIFVSIFHQAQVNGQWKCIIRSQLVQANIAGPQ